MNQKELSNIVFEITSLAELIASGAAALIDFWGVLTGLAESSPQIIPELKRQELSEDVFRVFTDIGILPPERERPKF